MLNRSEYLDSSTPQREQALSSSICTSSKWTYDVQGPGSFCRVCCCTFGVMCAKLCAYVILLIPHFTTVSRFFNGKAALRSLKIQCSKLSDRNLSA